ncbi:MAG: hypothetical protein KJO60_03560 [Desulfofustis sp.]|nr:hypothetical protein [Desulfofustis sp.]MBT8353573.1 hypothetical protein [Desulfofustis sp.]NNF46068.1 hypothetical protein [Desulfofustis sp.]NNK56531.1 hypothetical protein [Desulfofustis sp.]RZW23844.1 MAG: hypothetical protein EX260_04395 [Desulfobulbaceae bacterium]
MSNSNSFMNLWNFMELSEKQRLMRQFLIKHGDHFNKDDFIRFLALRYEDGRQESKPVAGTLKKRERRT